MIIFGIKIKTNKQIKYALTAIYGIGLTQSLTLCKKLNIPAHLKVKNLTSAQISNIIKFIKKEYNIESNLRKTTQLNIARLVNTKSYRGFRHVYSLPLRGQRTSTNAQTQKKLRRYR